MEEETELPPETRTAAILCQAVASATLVDATYNRTALKLAPYVVYTRDDALFVDAMVVARDGQARREVKLGAFKLAGLSEVTRTDTEFVPLIAVPVDDDRYRGGIIARCNPPR